MAQNKRKLFINSRVRFFFAAYVVFSILAVVLFLGWEMFMEMFLNRFPAAEASLSSFRGFPMVIKVTLLLVWGMSSFLLAYTYLDAKFMGIFERMDELFEAMLHNPELKLGFRKVDPFNIMADSFNAMKQMFLDRIAKRKTLIEQITSEIELLPPNPRDLSEQKLQDMIRKIDQELAS